MSFYLIKKEKGMTSHDVVSKVKKITNSKKVGHAGTLDPFATGLLVVATDGDTKFLDRFLQKRKTYKGILRFGVTTDTLDPEGKIIDKSKEKVNIDLNDLKNVINNFFIGKIKQTPPQFSAIKINGEKSYNLARKGIQTNLKPVERIIYGFNVNKINETDFEFEVDVSSGTYIRAIARDLGEKLNLPAMLTELERTKIDIFSLKNANSLNEDLKIIPRKQMIFLQEIGVSEEEMKRIMEGKSFTKKTPSNVEEFIAISNNTEVLMKKIGYDKYFINKRIN